MDLQYYNSSLSTTSKPTNHYQTKVATLYVHALNEIKNVVFEAEKLEEKPCLYTYYLLEFRVSIKP